MSVMASHEVAPTPAFAADDTSHLSLGRSKGANRVQLEKLLRNKRVWLPADASDVHNSFFAKQ